MQKVITALYTEKCSIAGLTCQYQLKVKMRPKDIPVRDIDRHFQTFSVADESLGEITCFSAGLHYL